MKYICRECREPCRVEIESRTKIGSMGIARCFWNLKAGWIRDLDEEATVNNDTECSWCKRVHDMNMACKEWVEDRMDPKHPVYWESEAKLSKVDEFERCMTCDGTDGFHTQACRAEGEKVQGRRVGKRNRRTPGLCNPHPQAGERRLGGARCQGRRTVDYPPWMRIQGGV